MPIGEKMKDLIPCIEKLRSEWDRHRKTGLKEQPTRIIFIDPLLQALGWDVRNHDEVEHEYTTIDGKSVDYALKINRKPVLFIEAKALKASLEDIKSITQIVSYATNDGVEWCILTNGLTYKLYRSTEKATAQDKLLFKISIDPEKSEGKSVQHIAKQLGHFSKDSMRQEALHDDIEEKAGSNIIQNDNRYLIEDAIENKEIIEYNEVNINNIVNEILENRENELAKQMEKETEELFENLDETIYQINKTTKWIMAIYIIAAFFFMLWMIMFVKNL